MDADGLEFPDGRRKENLISRREFSGGIAALAAVSFVGSADASSGVSKGPRLSRARSASSEVILLGFGEARDDSWFSPSVSSAFDGCDQLWLETAPPNLAPTSDAAVQAKLQQLSHTTSGTFYDCLTPEVRNRAMKRVSELGIDQKEISSLRPWRAYNVIMSAYFRRHPQAETKYVDQFLAKRAVAQGKKIGFEFPSTEAFFEFMAQMSPEAQDEYVSWLLTYLDEQDAGLNDRLPYDWADGHPPRMTRSLKRMIDMPPLYAALQTHRNDWWANKIVELLKIDGHHFIGVGLLHTIGPASIPNRLKSLGVRLDEAGQGTRR